ncbi:MAG: M28 family peptidase [Gemmatimonadaceae bacterium]
MIILCAAMLFTPGCERSVGPRTAFDGEAALEYVRTQLAFGPRIPGTEGHRRAGDWIEERMRALADTVIVQEWTHVTAAGDSLPMRNILARFRPEADDRILYLAHWDTRPVSERAQNRADRDAPVPGANDGASGVALLIGVADVLAEQAPEMGVDLLFVDGEDYGDFGRREDVLIGASYFAGHLPSLDYRPLFGVLWDMVADREIRFYQEGFSVQHAPEVVARVWRQAEDLGYSEYFVPRVGISITDDHVPLLQAGLRVIDVIDIDDRAIAYEHHHRPTDTLDKISAESLQIVGDVATALLLGES